MQQPGVKLLAGGHCLRWQSLIFSKFMLGSMGLSNYSQAKKEVNQLKLFLELPSVPKLLHYSTLFLDN